MNLDQEFEKLMNEVVEKIKAKQTAGEYDKWDAQYLTSLVENIIDHGDTSRCGNKCPNGHDDPNCGWSPSMGYHCL